MSFIRFCIQNPVTVAVGVILVLLFGILALFRIPIQLTPNVDIPVVNVATTWPGASPEEVEREIVYEQERFLKNVQGVVEMTSTSSSNAANISLEFAPGTDIDRAKVDVLNAIQQVPSYPENVDRPTISTSGAEDNAIAWFVLKSKRPRTDDEIDALYDFCDNDLKPHLERCKDVSQVNIYGGRPRELRVEIDPALLAANDLTFADVRNALVSENANISAGDFNEAKRRIIARVKGEYTTPEDAANVVISFQGGIPVHVRDVGAVKLGFKKKVRSVRNKGEHSIALNATRKVGSNVLEVMNGLKAAVAEANDTFLADQDLRLEQVYDETEYIIEAVDRVKWNIIIGAALASVVLLVFLRSFSSTLCVCAAIPICAVGTFLAVTLAGRTINVVMLAGISFAVGMVVDAAIVVLENIHRRRLQGIEVKKAALQGTTEVWGAVVASTLTTLAIFLPVIFDESEVAQLFRDIAIAVSAGVALSLIVSLTVIPTFASKIMKRHAADRPTRTALTDRLAGAIAALVGLINRRWATRLLCIVVLTATAFGLTWAMLPDTEYLPTGNRNLVFGMLMPPPGYNLDEMVEMGKRAEKDIRPLWEMEDDGTGPPGIRNFFFVAVGRTCFMGASAQRPERARELLPHVNAPLWREPGLFAFVQQSSLFGRNLTDGRTIDVNITGDDLTKLVGLGGRVFGMARGMFPPGTQIRPVPSLDLGAPEVQLIPNRHRMGELGLRNRDLGFLMDVFVDGAKIDEYQIDGEKIDITLVAGDGMVGHAESLDRVVVVADAEAPVTVGDVARIVHTQGPEQINHIEKDRAITIQVSPPEDVPLEAAMRRIRQEIVEPLRAEGAVGPGMRITLSGTADKLEETKDSMKWNFALAVLITYLLLAALFASFVQPLVILLSVPLAWVGGVLALALVDTAYGGQKLDVLTMLGFIILVGIVVNNAILIVHRALANLRGGSFPDPASAVADAVRARTRPILMSVLTSALGMLPLIVAPGAGSELYRGLGAVVVGGLLMSTVFTMFLVPAMFTTLADLGRMLRRG